MSATDPPTGPIRPRREERPLAAHELDDSQRQALEGCLRLIRGVVEECAEEDVPVAPSNDDGSLAFLPHIDSKRSNRVMLIDGARGSGKTSVLLTFLNMLARDWAATQEPALGFDAPRWMELRPPPQTVVPLATLDLATLPAPASILLQIGVRLSRVITYLEPEPEVGMKSLLDARDERASVRLWHEWYELVGAGWEADHEQRRQRLDPFVLAAEMEETEQNRDQVDRGLRDLVDAIALEWEARHGQLPVFLIAIDDADMSPRRTLELLRILRLVHHPRLAFVLTGDLPLFFAAARAQEALEMTGSRTGELPDGARGLPFERVYKVLPPMQRFSIAPMDLRSRMSKLHTSLERARSRIVLPLLRVMPQLLEALPDRMRRIDDLSAWIDAQPAPQDEALEDGPKSPIDVPLVLEIWSRAVTEEREERDWVQALVTNDVALFGDASCRLLVEDRIVIERSLRGCEDGVRPADLTFLPGDDPKSLAATTARVSVRASHVADERASLPPRIEAAWLLAWHAQHYTRGLGTYSGKPLVWRVLTLPGAPLGQLRCPLPVAPFRTPAAESTFLQLWDRERVAHHETPTEVSLLRRLLTLSYDVARCEDAPGKLAYLLTTETGRKYGSWSELAGRLTRLRTESESSAVWEWASQGVRLFATPEVGMTAPEIEDAGWLIPKVVLEEDRRVEFRALRVDSLERGLTLFPLDGNGGQSDGTDATAFVTTLSDAFPDHPWTVRVEGVRVTEQSRELAESIRQRLARHVLAAPDTAGPGSGGEGTLADLITSGRLEKLAKADPEDLRALQGVLDEDRKYSPSAVDLATELWNRVSLPEHDRQRGQDPDAFALVDLQPGQTAIVTSTIVSTSRSHGRTVRVHRLESPRLSFESPLSDVLYRLRHDLRVHESELKGRPLYERLWPPTHTIGDRGVWLSHPSPSLSSLADLELMVDWWQQVVDADELDELDDHRLLDRLFAWHLSTTRRILDGSRGNGMPLADLSDSESVVRRELKALQSLSKSRGRRVDNYLTELVVSAAPELGLSDGVARVLMRQTGRSSSSGKMRIDPATIRARWLEPLYSAAGLRLYTSDDYPDHPWFTSD